MPIEKEILDTIDEKTRKRIQDLDRQIVELDDILINMEAIKDKLKKSPLEENDKELFINIYLRAYKKYDELENELSKILGADWKERLQKVKKRHKNFDRILKDTKNKINS